MLAIILPLIVIPMMILATVGFITASREAAKTSSRYLKQRENDLRTIAEGVETATEAEVCAEIGFGLAQGFFFRGPEPVENL